METRFSMFNFLLNLAIGGALCFVFSKVGVPFWGLMVIAVAWGWFTPFRSTIRQ